MTDEKISLRDAALEYAARGWRVFPCRPRDKMPHGALVPRGCLDATTDACVIEEWWRRAPEANVGIACGAASDLCVIDIDDPNTEAARKLIVAPELEFAPRVATSAGLHLYVRFDERIKNGVRVLDGIDSRGEGGYVLAPPSIHPNGTAYAWAASGEEAPADALPAGFFESIESARAAKLAATRADNGNQRARVAARDVDALASEDAERGDRQPTGDPIARYVLTALDREVDALARVGEGSRNAAANTAAYRLGGYVHTGALSTARIMDALYSACLRNGLAQADGEARTRATLASGLQAGIAKPRPIPAELIARANIIPIRSRTTELGELGERENENFVAAWRAASDDEAATAAAGGVYASASASASGAGAPVVARITPRAIVRDDRVRIYDDLDEWGATVELERAISNDSEIYQRGGILVHCVPDAATTTRQRRAMKFAELTPSLLRVMSTRSVKWIKRSMRRGESVDEPCRPPVHVIAAVAQKGSWPSVRQIESVSAAPFFRRDGSICSTPGYDPTTGVIYDPPDDQAVDVPDRPTGLDVEAALETLLDVVRDFPFAAPEHRSAWVAGVLTLAARSAIRGPCPLFLIDAATQGSGKGLLARVTGIIGSGRAPHMTTHTQDESEERKRITTTAIEGRACVLIDNIEGRFGSPTLAAVLTSAEWTDRLLGSMRSYSGPISTVWIGTANNASISTDLARRTVHVRLDARVERPERRDGFAHAQLEEYVLSRRGVLSAAALTLLRGWHCADRPCAELRGWGSYEAWSDVVRQCIAWLRLPDPIETTEALRDDGDAGRDDLVELHRAWRALFAARAMPPDSILQIIRSDRGIELREAIDAVNGSRDARPINASKLGRVLTRVRDRVIDGEALRASRTSKSRSWTLGP